MANGYPRVLRDEATQSYWVDLGPNYLPLKRSHRIVKQDGKPYCLMCRDGRCAGTRTLQQWRREHPGEAVTIANSKPEPCPEESLKEWLEKRVATLDHKRHIEWTPKTELEKAWADIRASVLAGSVERERAGRAEHEQYQLWTKGRGQ